MMKYSISSIKSLAFKARLARRISRRLYLADSKLLSSILTRLGESYARQTSLGEVPGLGPGQHSVAGNAPGGWKRAPTQRDPGRDCHARFPWYPSVNRQQERLRPGLAVP